MIAALIGLVLAVVIAVYLMRQLCKTIDERDTLRQDLIAERNKTENLSARAASLAMAEIERHRAYSAASRKGWVTRRRCELWDAKKAQQDKDIQAMMTMGRETK